MKQIFFLPADYSKFWDLVIFRILQNPITASFSPLPSLAYYEQMVFPSLYEWMVRVWPERHPSSGGDTKTQPAAILECSKGPHLGDRYL